MTTAKRILVLLVLLSLPLLAARVLWAQAKPLTEADIIKLIELQLDDAVVVGRIDKLGLAFAVDDAVLGRLKKAGASDTLLAALQKAGKDKKPADKAITLDDILKLLELGVAEDKIEERLQKSPTTFTLGTDEVAKLKKAGASDRLIKRMQDLRSGGTPVSKLTDLAIILDCSGSMDEKTPDGISKMEAAKRVLSEVIPKIPDGMRMTFIIYGHDKELKCEAVKVVRPLAPLDQAGKEELRKIVKGLMPVSSTPIALSLRVAGKELAKKADALCGIILITDGMETCKGDPAAEAEKLTKDLNLTFGVNVVGFGLNEQETKAVKEIADRGKGKYYGAKSTRELNEALDELVRKTEPPKVVKRSRPAIKVLKPTVQLPAMKDIFVVPAGTKYGNNIGVLTHPSASIDVYDKELKLAEAEKIDIWFRPKEGHAVKMIANYTIPEGNYDEIKPEDYLGMVRVKGSDPVERLWLVKPGENSNSMILIDWYGEATKYGQDIVMPKGTWDLWAKTKKDGWKKIAAKVNVEAGKLLEID